MIDLEKVKSVRIAACDLNGQMRGKRLPGFEKEKFKDGSIRMPLSALNVDIFGADIENSPLVFETGDQDGLLKITSRGSFQFHGYKTQQHLYLCQCSRKTKSLLKVIRDTP